VAEPDALHDAPVGPASSVDLSWAEVLERSPDPAVITDPSWRTRLESTGLPWRVREPRSGAELLLVPPGRFERGAAADDAEAALDERPPHPVEVFEPYYLGRFEVSQAEWRAVLGDTPSFFRASAAEGEARRPVERVSHLDAQRFCAATGLSLPTESQWEYACRAGSEGARYGALDDSAWHHGNAHGRAHEVGALAANALGFHDQLGNVWEWTAGGYSAEEYARHRAPIDARAVLRAAPKAVLRGGSWYDVGRRARASARYAVERDFKGSHVGFRVARTL